MKKFSIGIVFLLLVGTNVAFSQEIDLGEPETQQVRQRQWDVFGTIHTNGFGIGGRFGRIHSIRLQSGFDFEYTYYRHFKERSYVNNNTSVMVYGKLAYMAQVRAGYGLTRIFATRPYWGGVEIGYFFYGGASLALSIPVYIQVLEISYQFKTIRATEDIYDGNIYIHKRMPIFHKLKGTKLHPGVYVKTGLSFDFARFDALILKLDIGAAADVYPIPIKKMAYSPAQYLLLTGYVSFHIGKKKTNYE